MSQAFWDGVKWGFAGRGSDPSPFRFLDRPICLSARACAPAGVFPLDRTRSDCIFTAFCTDAAVPLVCCGPGLQTRGLSANRRKNPASEEAATRFYCMWSEKRARRTVPFWESRCVLHLAAARRATAVFAFVAGAVRRHEHAAFGAGGRAVEHGTHARVLGRQIIRDRREQHMRHGRCCEHRRG